MLSNGIAVNFGVGGLTLSATGVGTLLLQDFDHVKEASLDMVRNETGDRVQKTWYDKIEKATLTYIPKGTGLADVITQTTLPEVGVFVNISACTSYPALVATNWEIVSAPKLKGTNTKAKVVTLQLEKAAGITATTPA